jgi:hypothetical protein
MSNTASFVIFRKILTGVLLSGTALRFYDIALQHGVRVVGVTCPSTKYLCI